VPISETALNASLTPTTLTVINVNVNIILEKLK
jgi:hypothetical protein